MAIMVNLARQPTKDPVCDMQIDPAKAISLDHDGSKSYFCSQGCASKFQADPKRYLQPSQAVSPKENSTAEKARADYVCPMHTEVHQLGPGNCPKCGMALEPSTIVASPTKIKYICPMHSQIIRDVPGNCPICGMALEPMTVTLTEANPELDSMRRRLWIGIGLAAPLLAVMVSDALPSHPIQHLLPGRSLGWAELIVASPVVLWSGWPFFQRGWASIIRRHLNMFTLISTGSGAAYLYSLAAVVFPELFPPSFRDMSGQLGLYFEAAAIITVFVLLGQVLELKARSATSGAIGVWGAMEQ